MADHPTTGAPALSTNIESGKFDEKETREKKPIVEDEEEDEDIDALVCACSLNHFRPNQFSNHCFNADRGPPIR